MSNYNKIIEAAMNSAKSGVDKAKETTGNLASKAVAGGKKIIEENPKTVAGIGGLVAGGAGTEYLINSVIKELHEAGYSDEQIMDYIVNNYNFEDLGA